MKSLTISEIALCYFPHFSKGHARRLFNDMLRKNPTLQQALASTYFNPSKRYLTPMQIELIYYYLGKP